MLFLILPINHLFKCQNLCELNPFSSMIEKQKKINESNNNICIYEKLDLISCNLNKVKKFITDPFFGRVYNYEISLKTKKMISKNNEKETELNLDFSDNLDIFYSSNIFKKFTNIGDNLLNGAIFAKILSINNSENLSTGLTLSSYTNSYLSFGYLGLFIYTFIISLYLFFIYEFKLNFKKYIFIFPFLYASTLHDTENFISIALNKQITYWLYILFFITTVEIFNRINKR